MGIILPIYTIIEMIETAENLWSDSCVCHDRPRPFGRKIISKKHIFFYEKRNKSYSHPFSET